MLSKNEHKTKNTGGTMAKRIRNFKKILVPVDFTPASESALKYGLSLATKYGGKLFVLHVVNLRGELAGFYIPHLSFEKLDDEMKKGAGEMLEKFTKRILKGFKNFEKVLLCGTPYLEIVRYAREENMDIIVMGTFGRSGIEGYLFGSTTERVMKNAEVPVLVVPPLKR